MARPVPEHCPALSRWQQKLVSYGDGDSRAGHGCARLVNGLRLSTRGDHANRSQSHLRQSVYHVDLLLLLLVSYLVDADQKTNLSGFPDSHRVYLNGDLVFSDLYVVTVGGISPG